MNEKTIRGIIGITDDGQPIVTADYQCPHFTEQAARLTGVQECWYCKFADFRKTCDIMLRQSICRCPQNRVSVLSCVKNEQDLQPSPFFEKFVSHIKGGIITCVWSSKTQSSKAVYLNAGWTAITGYTLADLEREMGGNPQKLVFSADQAAADSEYKRQVQMGNEYVLLYRVVRKDGTTIWVIDRGVVTRLSNGDIQSQSIVTEVTELKEQEAHLQRLAQSDQLTGLYNKAAFIQQAQMVLVRQYDRLHAMILLDVDDFKKITDSMGHAYGDQVLKAVGACIAGLFRARDVLGRVGDDAFMVLMTDLPNRETATQKAEELCAAMRGIQLDTAGCPSVTVSMGVALFSGEQTYAELRKQADTALDWAKNNGKNQVGFF